MRDSEKYNEKPLFWNYFEQSTIEFRAPGAGLTKFPGAKTCQFKKLGWLGEKDEGFTTEEEQEEAICHTAEAQDASKDVEMGF
jgi:hypothetical protein